MNASTNTIYVTRPTAIGDLNSKTPQQPLRLVRHHLACACREAQFAALLEEVMLAHATPGSAQHNDCDLVPCPWCRAARSLISGKERTRRKAEENKPRQAPVANSLAAWDMPPDKVALIELRRRTLAAV